jgi:hypothetical protein
VGKVYKRREIVSPRTRDEITGILSKSHGGRRFFCWMHGHSYRLVVKYRAKKERTFSVYCSVCSIADLNMTEAEFESRYILNERKGVFI